MRKTTDNMLNAIIDQRQLTQRNTSTHVGERGMLVRLHGHLIAVITADTVELSACGWVTATTADRLNAIAWAFTAYTVGRKQGEIVVTHRTTRERRTYGATDKIILPRIQ